MFLDLRVGNIREPLTGRGWDKKKIMSEIFQRTEYYQSKGMKASHRVFVHYGNNIEFFADLMAIWNLGGCVIPIDPRLTNFEVETLARAAKPSFSVWYRGPDEAIAANLSDLGIKIVVSPDSLKEGTPRRASSVSGSNVSMDEDALILFTSGTTGQPKGVVHTHRSLRARWIALRENLGLEKYQRTLCLLPTHFGHGLICNCLFPWLSGQDLFVVPPFTPDVLTHLGSILDKHEITFMSSVPSVWRIALRMARPPKSKTLARVFCGSAPLSSFLWREIQEWTGTNEVFNAYGITETGSWVAGTSVPGFTPEDGLIGVPWGAVIKVLKSSSTEYPVSLVQECAPGESGYVWLNTPALMRGYFGRDDLTKQVVSQGWFMTGDIGLVDDLGRLYLLGREREEINKGGMKVYPGDIDAIVERLEGVADVCCFGYSDDPLYGQNVGLAIVMNQQNDEAIRNLYGWMKRHLAKYQMPVRLYILDAIPRTSRGKINRVNVAEVCADLTPVDLKKLVDW